MNATARVATEADLDVLETLYGSLEEEMVGLKAIWAVTDGLPAPIGDSFSRLMAGPDTGVLVGEYHGVPLAFLVWSHRDLLPQANGRRIASIDLIFTSPEARRVGIGEAMMERFLAIAEEAGMTVYDGIAPPGHRHAKNFFESHGFKARRIVMHRVDE